MRRAARFAPHPARASYLAVFVLLVTVHAWIIAPGFFLTRLWEDEAYNLSVPLNLVKGLGYSSDGILTTGLLDPFDVRITTGPVVLLPIAGVLATGADPVLGARLVMAVFAVAALVAVFLTAKHFSGPWGALVALAATLGLDAARYPSPLQGPTDILGEWPTVLFTVLAIRHVQRRPALAGAMLGLALQCKSLAVLSLPVLALAVVLATAGGLLPRIRRLGAFGAVLVVPTAVFEMVKLVSLGLDGYVASTRDLYYFLRSGGGQVGAPVPYTDKVAYVLGSWFVPVALVMLTVALVIAVLVVQAMHERPWSMTEREPERERALHVLICVGILLTWLAWWTLSVTDPLWIRHPAPGLLVAIPLLGGSVFSAARGLLAERGTTRVLGVTAAAAMIVVVSVPIVVRPLQAWTPARETLSDQRAVADVLRGLPGDVVRGDWGAMPAIAVLAGKRPELLERRGYDSAPVLIVSVDPPTGARLQSADRVSSLCGPKPIRLRGYIICVAPSE